MKGVQVVAQENADNDFKDGLCKSWLSRHQKIKATMSANARDICKALCAKVPALLFIYISIQMMFK